jgi:hypothetical protein
LKDFFISYNGQDRKWAEWIAWELEEEGFSVVIQAWDFVGNWVIQMDRAMRETRGTIAVLSPNFTQALYTQPEWGNAFRLDPTGKSDLLIPVRIAPVEPEGILAMIVYVDFVGRDEEECAELLLRRVRGERGKPAVAPAFPGGPGEAPARRTIPQKPPFPAAQEDVDRLRRARDIAVGWRGKYAGKVVSLREAAGLARGWSREPPARLDDEVVRVIELAGEAARDFSALPLPELEYAKSYGLSIHETVFWGQALDSVTSTAALVEPETRAIRASFYEALRAQGAREPGKEGDDVPGKYAFEMIARVLESALALSRFNVGNLPRGYIEDAGRPAPGDLRAYENLFVAAVDSETGLHLIAVGAGTERVGSFAARQLLLNPLCAQRNEEGSLDLLAEDSQYLYYWSRSSPVPTMQFRRRSSLLEARFLSAAAGAPVATVAGDGAVTLASVEGRWDTLVRPSEELHLKVARIWVNELDEEDWHVVALTDKYEIMSGPRGALAASRSGEELWDEPSFQAAFGGKVFWQSHYSLTLTTLDGFPCVVIERAAGQGSGVHFLDPRTLVSIRHPLFIHESVQSMTIAAGRWLVVGLMSKGRVENRIVVWDLDADEDEPLGGWLEGRGDVYHLTVVSETRDSFQTVQVFRTFDAADGRDFQLCRFDWPSGAIERLEAFKVLQHLTLVTSA